MPDARAEFDEDRFVQRDQRLQRRVRAYASDTGEIAVGRVERLQHGVGHRAETECIERPAITLRPLLLDSRSSARSSPAAETEMQVRADKRSGRRSSGSSRPLAASAISRTISPSTRNRGPRASSRLYGSRGEQFRRHVGRLAVGCGRNDQRCIAFRLQP